MRVAIMTAIHSALDRRIFHKQALSSAQAGYDVFEMCFPGSGTACSIAQPKCLTIQKTPGIEQVGRGERYGESGRRQEVNVD